MDSSRPAVQRQFRNGAFDFLAHSVATHESWWTELEALSAEIEIFSPRATAKLSVVVPEIRGYSEVLLCPCFRIMFPFLHASTEDGNLSTQSFSFSSPFYCSASLSHQFPSGYREGGRERSQEMESPL